LAVLNHGTELAVFPAPVHLALQALGTSVVEGARAFGYSLTPTTDCSAPLAPHQPMLRPQIVEVWVDTAGRLVKARTTVTERLPPNALPGFPKAFSGTSTTTSTVWLSDFGTPVHIVAPTVTHQLGYSSSVAVLIAQGDGCPDFISATRAWVSVSSSR
jgi:hypothetical protein